MSNAQPEAAAVCTSYMLNHRPGNNCECSPVRYTKGMPVMWARVYKKACLLPIGTGAVEILRSITLFYVQKMAIATQHLSL